MEKEGNHGGGSPAGRWHGEGALQIRSWTPWRGKAIQGRSGFLTFPVNSGAFNGKAIRFS